ncbi:MAG: peptidylprolyl isomerase [Polyangiaceae bacterium]|nr:peptidylprolyl isomerase [Polyangiaceae bacterium]
MTKSSNWLLACGALAGVVIATAGVVRAPRPPLADDAVATVNGSPIRRADYETALAAVAADGKRKDLDAAMKRHVLDRLIDEELLVQAALELGLAQRDRRVRADLSSAALAFVKESPAREPSDAELQALFDANPGFFGGGARFEVEELFFRGAAEPARQRAEAARRAWLRGESVTADPPALPIPTGPLPLAKLEQYAGPAAARAVLPLPPGGITEPLSGGDGVRLLRVKARRDGAPRFEDVRSAVQSEWRRRTTEDELRRFLSDRRARAKVSMTAELGS